MSHHPVVDDPVEGVAIIGMAGRFPGAATVDEFWTNVRNGVESLTFFTDAELLAEGTDPALLRHPKFVKAKGLLPDVDLFDAQFFGYTPQEARVMDPQQRIFLECGWHALEDAGYHAETYRGGIGVFAGANFNQYLVRHVLSNPGAGPVVAFDKDFLATKLSYKLNLKGPSLVIQTACSTSLVAVAQACQSLLTYQCDMALAGGVAVHLPSRMGYLHQEGGILSPDGHCRAFDANARGTVIGSGVGIVVLKRLADAIADGDSIRAVIRGFAVNNDGSSKMGYMAPSIDGQAQVIAMAQALAGVEADSIGYVEAHGTGTELGDPIEVAALTQAFRASTSRTRFCALGSVKTNIGHLDSAAGVAGLIKTALMLEHKELAPSLHFEQPNPKIDFASSPFFVSTKLAPWKEGSTPRRAGVSSFGIGGTNVHLVLEEAPPREPSGPSRSWQILTLSARTPGALKTATTNLAQFLEQHPGANLADVACTLQVGRKPFAYRRAVVCTDASQAARSLRAEAAAEHEDRAAGEHPVVFMFPGDPAARDCGASDLYRSEATFRQAVDRCAEALDRDLADEIRPLFTTGRVELSEAAAHVALFSVEYALAELFMSWGIEPAALLADGIGEMVAACVSGVISVDQALQLAALRARSLEGATPSLTESVERWAAGLQPRPPQVPWIARASGSWVTEAQLRDRTYWLRLGLLASKAPASAGALPALPNGVFLELGPGDSLSALVGQAQRGTALLTVPALPDKSGAVSAPEAIARAIGQLWVSGVEPGWSAYYAGERRQRVALPQYPFERHRYWIERGAASAALATDPTAALVTGRDVKDWFYVPVWRRSTARDEPGAEAPDCCLVFIDGEGLGERLASRLAGLGAEVIRVRIGPRWEQLADGSFAIDPAERAHYDDLVAALRSTGREPGTILHLWGAHPAGDRSIDERLDRELAYGFYSVLYLVQALGDRLQSDTRLSVLASHACKVTDRDALSPGKATVTGLCRVIPHEYPNLRCQTVDVAPAEWANATEEELHRLVADLCAAETEPVSAYRQGERWIQTFERAAMDGQPSPRLKAGGTYLITGGLGSIGLTFAGHLASTLQAKLVLVGRHGLPPRDRWAERRSSDDPAARRIRAIQAFEREGAQVMVAAADVSDEEQMRAVVDQAIARFGAVDGVIHAAGLMAPAAFKPLRALDRAGCAEHFRPKITGTRVLERVFEGREPEFFLLASSLSAILGGLSFGAYAAANAFMDAFASARAHAGWTSVNWDGWRAGAPRPSHENPTAHDAGITAQDGVAALQWVLNARVGGRVAVSATDLGARAAKWVAMRSMHQAGANALPAVPLHPRPQLQTEYVAPRTDLERAVAEAWREVLGVDPIGIEDNFFDLGGDSFLGLQLIAGLNRRLAASVSPVSLYEGPTVAALAAILASDSKERPAARHEAPRGRVRSETPGTRASQERGEPAIALPAGAAAPEHGGIERHDVAIIGLAGRFPGASTLDRFWQNLRDGVEARTVFSDDELRAAGISSRVLALPRFVKSGFPLDGVDRFDAAFFGINPREAELLDPQQRLFLECAWEALENAGYDGEVYRGAIGVFGGCTPSSYLTNNVLRSRKTLKAAGARQSALGNVGDYMVTRVAYKLNLKGPCYLVQTACSTSLVAVHLGCQSLKLGESDMVLAGGVSVMLPQRTGYLYEEGGMLSPDGVCRAFDANARGTAFGSGVGVVVLKRLRDALRDGDHIYAVVRGGATNNDGSLKVGFTAPSVAGQADVIAEAMANAGVSPDTVSYVEAHGTGTELGDPIEVAALTRAYRGSTNRAGFCALGSVKPNIGHLDAAAGVSSLIKTVLALAHRELPPTINFERPNPKVDFDNSPFYVNTSLRPWHADGVPRRAGVSSFGFGGTNAHLVLEEAPVAEPSGPARPCELLVLSARTETALEAACARLAEELRRRPDLPLADVAYTLQVGRRPFAHRRAIVCSSAAEAADALDRRDARRSFAGHVTAKDRRAIFLFPGQGAQHVNMGLDLYNEEPVFRATVDECAERLQEELGFDLRDALYPADGDSDAAAARLTQTMVAQAALFATELALARMWIDWGIHPEACLGHSIGELVAACVSGVMQLSDALRLVALRGRVMSEMPEGVMVAVPLSEERVSGMLGEGLWLSAVNGPSLSVVSGRRECVDALVARLADAGIQSHRLHTSHAFHSGLMDGAVDAFVRGFNGVTLSRPQIPFLSNVTGDWITEKLATDPGYWGQHIRQPVRFAEGARTLMAEPNRLFLEVGPGNTLGTLVRQQGAGQGGHVVLSSLPHPQDKSSGVAAVLTALGRLWTNGAAVDWYRFQANARRVRVPLPAYPFERERYWVEPDTISPAAARRMFGLASHDDLSDWFHVPSWKRIASRPAVSTESDARSGGVLLFIDASGIGSRVAEGIAALGRSTVVVEPGDKFARSSATRYVIDPRSRADYVTLLRELRLAGSFPGAIGHFWGVTGRPDAPSEDDFARRCEDLGFYSLLYLSQAIGEVSASAPVSIGVITDGVHEVVGQEPLVPEKATVLGPCHVIPQEFTNLGCRNIDLVIGSEPAEADVTALVAELLDPGAEPIVAFRGGRRWAMSYEPMRLERARGDRPSGLRPRGVYLITGGTGGIGLVLAKHLARTVQARLVLTSRHGLPPRETWPDYHSRSESDRTARQIAVVRELETAGAEVLVAAADVADEPAMRAVVDEAVARFGRIDGVIHAAGIAGGGMVQLKQRETAAEVLRPKVTGTRVLARVLANQQPDFLLLCSSLTSVVGGVGQIDYCGANAYLDAFARHYSTTTRRRAVAVNWTAWREVGMATEIDASVPESLRQAIKEEALAAGLSNEEGVDAFCRVLAQTDERQIAISSRDVSFLLEESRAVRLASSGDLSHAAGPGRAAEDHHPRPDLQSAFVAPRSDAEERICTIWQENLGIDRVGIDDNFFELGGHSLLAVRVMTRVNEELGTEIPVAKLYEGLTVRFLAVQAERGDQAEIGSDVSLAERRRDKTRRQKEHQQRRRALMRR